MVGVGFGSMHLRELDCIEPCILAAHAFVLLLALLLGGAGAGRLGLDALTFRCARRIDEGARFALPLQPLAFDAILFEIDELVERKEDRAFVLSAHADGTQRALDSLAVPKRKR